MKTLSAFTTTKTDSPCVDIVRIAKIEFSGVTLNLCDRVWGDAGSECEFNGTLYEPFIESWGTIKQGRINPVTYEVEPGSAELSIFNGVPVGGADSFAELFKLYYPHFVTVTISELHVGASAAEDAEDIFKGSIEDFPAMTTDIVSLTCSGIELSIANKFAHNMVEATTYAGADPDDLGKMLPQVYGQAKRVPFMAVDAGGITTLAEDLGAGVTGNVNFSDVSGLPASGTVQIDAEQMTYGSKSDANFTLNISSRGTGGTDAVAHNLGATVAEIQTDYFYIIGHAVKTFDAVYVAGVKQPSANYTAYTGQTGDAHASYPGKACVKFTVLPVLTKQINVTLNDAITVDDNIGFNIGGSTKTIYPNGNTNIGVADPTNAYDGNETSYADIYKADWSAYLTLLFASTNYGTIATQYIWAKVSNVTNGDQLVIGGGWAPSSLATDSEGWFRFQKSGGSWSDSITFDTNISRMRVHEVRKEVDYAPSATKSGGAYRGGAATLTGNSVADTVIGGRVSADVDGFQDDGSGTYTGTPDALIERPDHILKHILGHRCGLTLADVIDSTTYTAAGTFYNTNSYVLAFAILEKPNVRLLINRIARQAKSIEIWEAGVHKLIHLPDAESTDKSINGHRIDLGQIWTKYTDRADVKNTLSARYDRHWDGYTTEEEADRAVVTATDSASVTRWGTLQGVSFSFPYIPGSTQAQAVLDMTKKDLRNPRLIVEAAGGYFLTDLERGDIIEFANVTVNEGDIPTYLQDALPGLVEMSWHQFRVIDVIYRPDTAIQIETILLNPIYRKDIEGKYDIYTQGLIEGKYDIFIQELFEGKYDIYAQDLIEGKYDIFIQDLIECKYDIFIQGLIEGKYDIYVQDLIEGKYDIFLQDLIEGKYNINTPDTWGDGDTWADGDTWI